MTEYDQRINLSDEQKTTLDAARLLCYQMARNTRKEIEHELRLPLFSAKMVILDGETEEAKILFRNFMVEYLDIVVNLGKNHIYSQMSQLERAAEALDCMVQNRLVLACISDKDKPALIRQVKDYFQDEADKSTLEAAALIAQAMYEKPQVHNSKETSEDDTAHNES